MRQPAESNRHTTDSGAVVLGNGREWDRQVKAMSSRRGLALLLTATIVLLLVLDQSLVGIMASMFAITLLVAVSIAPSSEYSNGHRRGELSPSVVSLMPLAFIFAAFAALVLLLVSGSAGKHLTGNRLVTLTLAGLVVVVFLAIAWVRSSRVCLVGDDLVGFFVWMAFVLIGISVVLFVPMEVWLRNTTGGTDFARHLILVRQIIQDGGVDYFHQDYPRGIHALVAMLLGASGQFSFRSTWLLLQATNFFVLSLMLLSVVLVAIRLMRIVGGRHQIRDISVAAGLLVALLQSMWVTTMLEGGFVTSLMAGLLLATILLPFVSHRPIMSTLFLVSPAVITAMMANTWTLLVPATASVWILTWFWAWKTSRILGWNARALATPILVGLTCSLVSMAAIGGLMASRFGDGDLVTDLSALGYSGLEWPDFWWWPAPLVCAILITALWSRGVRLFVGAWLLLALSGLLTVIGLSLVGGGFSIPPSYYVGKTLWTAAVIFYSVVGAALGLATVVLLKFPLRVNPGLGRIVASGVVALVIVVPLAGTLGRHAGTPSKVYEGVKWGFAAIPIQLPVVEHFEDVGWPSENDGDVLVWGMFPYGTVESVLTSGGYLDLVARESTAWFNPESLIGSDAVAANALHDEELACTYLREHPSAIRITGPNPVTGAEWLVASGCPREVVKSGDWITISLDAELFRATPFYGRPYHYPTYSEYQMYLSALADEREGSQGNQTTPAPSQN